MKATQDIKAKPVTGMASQVSPQVAKLTKAGNEMVEHKNLLTEGGTGCHTEMVEPLNVDWDDHVAAAHGAKRGSRPKGPPSSYHHVCLIPEWDRHT